jgi:hypothetical protein
MSKISLFLYSTAFLRQYIGIYYLIPVVKDNSHVTNAVYSDDHPRAETCPDFLSFDISIALECHSLQ